MTDDNLKPYLRNSIDSHHLLCFKYPFPAKNIDLKTLIFFREFIQMKTPRMFLIKIYSRFRFKRKNITILSEATGANELKFDFRAYHFGFNVLILISLEHRPNRRP